MRPIGWLDLDAVARCVLRAPPGSGAEVADLVLQRAQTADRYRKKLQRRHPETGDGSLSAAAETLPKVPVSARLDADYLDALALALGRIRRRASD